MTNVLTQMYFIFFVGKCCPVRCNSESTVYYITVIISCQFAITPM